jgi:hypothetical protein
MSATLLLAAFVAYLYVPFLLFTFFAEDSIDLGRLKDESRIGEFFGAALPSALLNALTWLVLRILFALDRWHIVRSPAIDWTAVASILDPAYGSLRSHIATGPAGEIQYLVVLFLAAAVCGSFYGRIELALIQRGAEREFFLRRGAVKRHVAWAMALGFRRIWIRFFAERISHLFVWMATETWMFVRTKDRLFYGRFFEYVKTADGEIENIVLVSAQRYSRRSPTECFETGVSPLTKLQGSLVIRWSEIADINIVSPSMMGAVRRAYARKLRDARDRRSNRLRDSNPKQ